MLLSPKQDKAVKQQAHRFLKAAVSMLLSGEDSSTALTAYIEGRLPTSPNEAAESFVLGGDTEPGAAVRVRTLAEVEHDERMAKILFAALFAAAGDPDLKDDTDTQPKKLVDDLCRHFGLLYLTRTSAVASPGIISFGVFLDALEAACESEERGMVDVAIRGLECLMDTLIAVAGGQEKACQYPMVRELGERAVHCCYKRDWFSKRGGAMMIGSLCGKASAEWCMSMQPDFLKGLLFVFKDLEPESSLLTSAEAAEALKKILKSCSSTKLDAMSDTQKQCLQLTFGLLLSELPSSNQQVRRNAQSSLELIAELTGAPLASLLKPFQKSHISVIFSRNLSQIGVRAQIGFLDALSFCIALDGVLPMEDELFATLQKALDLTTQAEAAIEKATTGRGSRSVIDLRTTCIELMMNAMSLKAMHEPQHTELRNAIVSMFFKSLTYKAEAVLTAAKGGLAKVVNAHQLPKELLQSSLRPILLNLAVHHNLSLGLLQGLSRLLELLSNCFNVTLGEKLLEHLHKWLEPDKITQSKVWKAGEEVRVAAATLDLFHLLPPAPQKFMDPIVGLVVKLEALYPSAGLHSGEEDEVQTEGSVFRAPLIRFMNRHPSEAVDYFLERLHLEDSSRLFHHMLRSELGQPLRDGLMAHPEKLIKHAFTTPPVQPATTAAEAPSGVSAPTSLPNAAAQQQPTSDALGMFPTGPVMGPAPMQAALSPSQRAPPVQNNGVSIVAILAQKQPQWLREHGSVLGRLVAIWNSPERKQRLLHEEQLMVPELRETKLLLTCFLSFCTAGTAAAKDEAKKEGSGEQEGETKPKEEAVAVKEEAKPAAETPAAAAAAATEEESDPASRAEIDILFHMLSIFGTRTLVDLSFLKNFYLITVAKTYSVKQKRQILKHFLVFFKETSHTQEHKARALQLLIVPMLTECFQKKAEAAELVSSDLVSTVVKQLLEYKESDPMYEESLSIELLHLATSMIQHIPNELIDHRKELIKFAWSHLACCAVKRGVSTLCPSEDTLCKLCAYVNVCRFIEAYETPSKIILQVYVALLRTFEPEAKALVKAALDILTPALPKRLPPAENHKYPSWIKWTKKIIVEEGHSLSQLIHIWQLLVRHPQLFYNCRAQFVPQMVNSLTRIGSAPKCPVENLKLTVDLAQLIIKWDTRCIETQAGSVMANDIPPEVLALTGPDDHFRPSHGMVEMVVNYLMRVAFMTNENAPAVSRQCIELIDSALGIWPDANIKFAYIEKFVGNSDNRSHLLTALSILNVVGMHDMEKYVLANIPQVEKIFEMCFICDKESVVKPLCNFLNTVSLAFPIDESYKPITQSFYARVGDMLDRGLSNAEKMYSQHCAVMVLKTMCECKPDFVDRYSSSLVKLFSRMVKDHIAPRRENTPAQASSLEGSTSTANEVALHSLQAAIQVLSMRILYLEDQRKAFFQCITTLIEKSTEINLLVDLTRHISHWILADDGGFSLSVKDNAFMIGLRCGDPTVRQKFFKIFHDSVAPGLPARMQYILQVQNWESLKDSFWVKQAGQLLLSAAESSHTLELAKGSSAFAPLPFPRKAANTAGDALTPAGVEVVKAHKPFLDSLIKLQVDDLMSPLMELTHESPSLAAQVWIAIFPAAWSCLAEGEQRILAEPIGNLLQQDYHAKQAAWRPNAVQTLFKSFLRCEPAPELDPIIVKHLGNVYNCWGEATPGPDVAASSVADEMDVASLVTKLSENSSEYMVSFTLEGFAAELGADGLYVLSWLAVNGKPAFMLDGDRDRWCCYVEETDEWQIQTEALKGQNDAIAYTGAAVPWDPAAEWEQYIEASERLFPESIGGVLKRVHPDTEIDENATKALDDVLCSTLQRLVHYAMEFQTSRAGEPIPEDEHGEHVEKPSPLKMARRSYKAVPIEVGMGPDKSPVYIAVDTDIDHDIQLGLGLGLVDTDIDHDISWQEKARPVCCVDACDGRTMPVVDTRAIQTAVHLLFPVWIAKYAVSEGTKAVTKYGSNGDRRAEGEAPDLARMAHAAGLQFLPPRVIAYAQSLPGAQGILTDGAAVYLTAVLEYISAELLELGGNACRDRRDPAGRINSRDIRLAVSHDPELTALCRAVRKFQEVAVTVTSGELTGLTESTHSSTKS